MAKFIAVGTCCGLRWPNVIMFSIKDSQGKIFEGNEIVEFVGEKLVEHINRVIPVRSGSDKIGKIQIQITIKN